MQSPVSAALAACSAAVCLSLVACAPDGSVDECGGLIGQADTDGPTGPPREQLEGFTGTVSGSLADYEPVDSPGELAEMSSLVVLGRIAAVTDGRAYGRADSGAPWNRTVLVHVDVREVLHGDDQFVCDGQVHVEISSLGGVPGETFDRSVPKTLDVLMYLVPYREPGPIERQVMETAADWPTDAPIMRIINPQGFIIDSGRGQVGRVLAGEWVRSRGLSSYLPD